MEPNRRAQLTHKIKKRARQLGFHAVGVSPADPGPDDKLRVWLELGFQGSMDYLERQAGKRLDPGKVLPGVRSMICLALAYPHSQPLPYDDPNRGVISRYASGDDYHSVMGSLMARLLESIREELPGVGARSYVDSGPVMDKYWASRAGIGWLGKHTNILDRKLGSWFFLGEILLDVELDYGEPALDHCGSCTRCIDACPTDAIVEPYLLDSRRCISYLTIELKEDIPEDLREPMGNLVFGCDICQDVCPWNHPVPDSSVLELEPRRVNRSPELWELAQLSPDEFRERFSGSPVKRAKWRGFVRNVAVAMGNSGNPGLQPELTSLLDSEDPMVRRHAGWALKQLGTREALDAVRRRCSRESDSETRATLRELLDDEAADPAGVS